MSAAGGRFDAVTERALPSRVVTELHLLRHGEVETGGLRLAYGQLDLPLSPTGRAQARALTQLARAGIPPASGVISSDARRCLDTARDIAEALDLPLTVTPALREQHFGDWEGRAWADLTAEDPEGTRAYWADYVNRAPPGGESLRALQGRVQGWWAAEQATLRGGRWLVVTHIGVIRALLCGFLDHPLEEALRFAPPRGSHTHLSLAEAGAVLAGLGERLHPAPPPAAPRPRTGPVRLAVSGSAGVGKTTLGRAMARALDLPFIEEGMRRRLEAGLRLHDLDHAGLRALVMELWAEHRAAEDEALRQAGGFVADRCSLDFTAFWLYYGFAWDREATAAFVAETTAHAARYDAVALLPWGVLPLEDDGVRSPNPWLQRHFHATVEGVLSQELPPDRLLRMPPLHALEARQAWLEQALAQAERGSTSPSPNSSGRARS